MSRNDTEHERALAGPDPLIPEPGVLPAPVRLFRVNWVGGIHREPSGAPVVSAEFVAAQGRRVRLIDVRDAAELTGALGHLPGSDWVPVDEIEQLPRKLDRDDPVVLVARTDERSKKAAALLESQGMRMVAALQGGIVAWKAQGFSTSRDPRITHRKGELRAIPTFVEEPARHLTVDDVKEHVGDPFAVRHVKFAALLLHGRLSCVDGRDDSGVVGTPGGDAGEFLLALAALERVTGKELSEVAIAKLLRRRLDVFGRFYLHTDLTAGNAYVKALRADRRFESLLADVWHTHQWRKMLTNPPQELRPAMLDLMLSSPAHIGCGHVRLSIQNAETYGTRALLVETFLRLYFTQRWNGAVEAEFVALGGGHRESAVVNVVVDGGVHSFTQLPLVSPSTGGQQMFVNHPQVAGFLRKELVEFLCQQTDVVALSGDHKQALLAEVTKLGQQQMMATLERLAAGLPIFNATFGAGDVVVEAAGHVPGGPVSSGAGAAH